MGKLNFDIDEASLLKTYGISSLTPSYALILELSPLLILHQQQMGGY